MTTIAGRYELDPAHIGRGGMGEVWGATDVRLRRRVAVKFIRFPGGVPDPKMIKRFVRESQLTARMEHPGVPVLYDAARVGDGPFEGRLYLVMQLIDGIGVDDLVAEHDPLPIGWAAAIAAQTCAVLGYAHAQKLVHRDLKPSNLMVDKDGAVKVLDFGLSVALDADERSRLSSSNEMLGTLAYMAPEQFQGGSSTLSDLYSLGCVLYRMLSGRDPFDGPTQASIMHAQIYQEAVPVRQLRADVPPDLEELVHLLLAKQPKDRPACADEVYDLLLPHIGDLPELPGAVRPGLGPARRYAGILGRPLTARATTTAASRPPQPAISIDPTHAQSVAAHPERGPVTSAAPFSLSDVSRVRRRAERLTLESRYDEAIRMLTHARDRAEEILGTDHSEVVTLRIDLADLLFKAGDYGGAASAFHALAQDLSRCEDTDTDLVLRLRLHEANSHALSGDVTQALQQLHALLDDQVRIYGTDDERILDLRGQIGLLLYGTGQADQAIQSLGDLVADLDRIHGPDHPVAHDMREKLNGMRRR